MNSSIIRRLRSLEESQSALPIGYVYFEDGHREKWDLAQIAKAFFGDGGGVCRVEWLRNEPGLILQLLANEAYWNDFREVKHDTN